MLRTLYSRLALTLFALLLVVGLLLIQLIRHSGEMYQQEVAQKLNATLAGNIVAEQLLISEDQVNSDALKQIFHMLMVINPSIELYLLDRQGGILAYSAPEGKVKRSSVDLAPVRNLLDGDALYPLTGDDPRNPEGQKVFSAARIPAQGPLQGYLYIVLGGEQYDNIVQSLHDSYILRTAGWVLLGAMATALLLGLLTFSLLTRRLRTLSQIMDQYADYGVGAQPAPRYPIGHRRADEVDRLGKQFNRMADRIDDDLRELQGTDALRRELVANISHDLRTPLTTLQGYLETLLLKGEALTEAERNRYLETALSHGQRLNQLVSELFELARLESSETIVYSEPFSLAELVQDVCSEFQLKAEERDITLVTDLQSQPPLVHGDIALMQRVLENLLENALRHTPAGGRVSVGVVAGGDSVMIRVADTGCGIPESEIEHIFDRFYRVASDQSDNSTGTGLGLAIAKRILELHGATIDVRSRLHEGSVFSFRMPVGHGSAP